MYLYKMIQKQFSGMRFMSLCNQKKRRTFVCQIRVSNFSILKMPRVITQTNIPGFHNYIWKEYDGIKCSNGWHSKFEYAFVKQVNIWSTLSAFYHLKKKAPTPRKQLSNSNLLFNNLQKGASWLHSGQTSYCKYWLKWIIFKLMKYIFKGWIRQKWLHTLTFDCADLSW